MMKFRSKLLFAILSLLIFLIVILGVFLVQLINNHNRDIFYNNNQKQVVNIAEYIESNGGMENVLNDKEGLSSLNLVMSSLTLVSSNGEILYMANPPEIIAQERHEAYVTSLPKIKGNEYEKIKGGLNLFYFWHPIYTEHEKLEGYVMLTSELPDILQLEDNTWFLLLGVLAISLVIIMIITLKISNRFTKPIEAATNTAIELAKGNFRARIYENPTDETRTLSKSLNILARNLQEMETTKEMQQDRLSTLIENIPSGVLVIDSKGFITLMNKSYKKMFRVNASDFLYKLYYEALTFNEVIQLIEEIFMTEKSIKKQMVLSLLIERKHFVVYGAPIISNADEWKGIVLVFHDITELKKLEQVRQDFVANVSHELRTPITSIKGFSETILDSDLKDEKMMREFLTIILNESNRLQVLIQELLELSKIEKQEFTLSLTRLDINSLILEIGAMFSRKVEKKNIELTIHQSPSQLMVNGDSNRLKQIFINLISNAIKYTPENGKVDVLISEDGPFAVVEVKDTGIGIEQNELPRIFERFYRVDRARSRDSGGTGLGLAIAKHLVEAHNGHIFVKSKIGQGTSFIVKFKKTT